MKTRLICGGIVAALGLIITGIAYADQGPVITQYGPGMRFGIPYDSFAQAYNPQHESEDCWAASISNIFAFYGHPVDQSKIEASVFGADLDQPAMPYQISQAVNHDWKDDDGKNFHSHLTAAYDAFAHVGTISNPYLVNQLLNNHPLLVCNTHHCMVIVAVDVVGPQIVNVIVFDPWPTSGGAHLLPPIEAVEADNGGQCTYIGAVKVTDADDDNQDNSNTRLWMRPMGSPFQFASNR